MSNPVNRRKPHDMEATRGKGDVQMYECNHCDRAYLVEDDDFRNRQVFNEGDTRVSHSVTMPPKGSQ